MFSKVSRFYKNFFTFIRSTTRFICSETAHSARGIKAYLLTDKTKIVDRLDATLCDFSALSGVISDFEFPDETKKRYPEVNFIFVEE